MNENKRIVWVDYLKAFTCLLVVIGHLLQSLQKAGIPQNLQLTNFIIYYIYLFHMPLFMCISGFLYSKKKLEETSLSGYIKFEKRKLIDLMIPYFIFYLLYLGINILFAKDVNTPKGKEELLGILNNPMSPYWFLYALMAIFLITPVLEKIFKENKNKVFILYTILKIISIFYQPNIYFIKSISAYGIYFYLGCFISDKKLIGKREQSIFILLHFVIAIIIFKYLNNVNKYIYQFIALCMAICGIIVYIEIFKNVEKNKVLNTFKSYIFQIFLLHTIFAAGIRIILLKFKIQNYFIHFIVGILSSIYLPVFVSKISEKIKYTQILFFPTRTIQQIKERKIKV